LHLITGSWDAPCAISWIVLADKISVFRRCGLCSWKGSIWSLLNNNAIRLQKINAYWHIRSFVPCIFASGKYIFLSLWICYVGNINLGIIVVLMSRHGLIFLYMHVLVFHIVFISAGYGTSKRRICALCDSYIIWGSYRRAIRHGISRIYMMVYDRKKVWRDSLREAMDVLMKSCKSLVWEI